jgi:hypothetical protein
VFKRYLLFCRRVHQHPFFSQSWDIEHFKIKNALSLEHEIENTKRRVAWEKSVVLTVLFLLKTGFFE